MMGLSTKGLLSQSLSSIDQLFVCSFTLANQCNDITLGNFILIFLSLKINFHVYRYTQKCFFVIVSKLSKMKLGTVFSSVCLGAN